LRTTLPAGTVFSSDTTSFDLPDMRCPLMRTLPRASPMPRSWLSVRMTKPAPGAAFERSLGREAGEIGGNEVRASLDAERRMLGQSAPGRRGRRHQSTRTAQVERWTHEERRGDAGRKLHIRIMPPRSIHYGSCHPESALRPQHEPCQIASLVSFLRPAGRRRSGSTAGRVRFRQVRPSSDI
jgi:hypothetical protein